jgi:hypothetical protein
MKTAGVSVLLVSWILMGCGSEMTTAGERSYPEPESPGGQILLERCGTCHGAPLPATHTAKEWPTIVQRMQQRMVSKAFQPLSEPEQQTLVNYLQQHAGTAP